MILLDIGPCVGNIPAQPKHNWPGLCLQDSVRPRLSLPPVTHPPSASQPLGVRFASHVSAFPAGINAASTFDRVLIRARGAAMGKEFRGKGAGVALGPMM